MQKPVYVTVTRLSFEPIWQIELVKLKRIQALNQRHIVKLITAFRQGEEDLYFLSETSDGGNLRDFWETFPRVLTASLVKSVTEQLHGLAFASFEVGLTTALIEGSTTVSNDNLNPENILWFKDGSRLAINSTINSIPSILWKLKSRASIQSIPFDTPIDCFNST
jgi:serine/threonine protein kinase